MRRESGETKEIFAINIKTIKVVKKLMEMARKISWKIEDTKKILPYFWALIKLEKINRSTWFWIFKFSITKERKNRAKFEKAQTVNKKDASAPFLLQNLLDFFFLPARMGGGRESGGERSKLRGGWKNLPRVSLRGPTPFVFLPNRLLSLEKKRQKKYRNKVEMSHSGFKISTSRFCFNWLSKEKEKKKLNKSCFFRFN